MSLFSQACDCSHLLTASAATIWCYFISSIITMCAIFISSTAGKRMYMYTCVLLVYILMWPCVCMYTYMYMYTCVLLMYILMWPCVCTRTCTCTHITVGTEGYRPVYFPADTASRFEEVASPNTRKNVETCGILAGKLVCTCVTTFTYPSRLSSCTWWSDDHYQRNDRHVSGEKPNLDIRHPALPHMIITLCS